MKKNVYVTIGNTDNRLTQQLWSEFCYATAMRTGDLVRIDDEPTNFAWYSPSHHSYQSAAFHMVLSENRLNELKEILKDLCMTYGQDCIAMMVGEVEFITAGTQTSPDEVDADDPHDVYGVPLEGCICTRCEQFRLDAITSKPT